MYTLTIPAIFSNLSFYQENYLQILSDPTQFNTPVEGAYINIWPIGSIQLLLGDLLQLWFSEKWLINEKCQQRATHKDDGRKFPLQRNQDLYLYQLAGSALSGSNRAKVWSVLEQKVLSVELDSALKYYCYHKATERDLHLNQRQLIQALHKAI